MENFSHWLTESDASHFYSRHDPNDERLGDVVVTKPTLDTRFALIGFPEDRGVARNKGRIGQAQGPDEIRKAFYKLPASNFETNVILKQSSLCDFGNVSLASSLEGSHERLADVVAETLRQNLLPIVLGGGHDLAYADFCGLRKVYEHIGLVNFDAHFDLRPVVSERNSGTPFYQIVEEHPDVATRFVEIGLQPSANVVSHYAYAQKKGIKIFPLQTVFDSGIENVLQTTADIITAGSDAVYCTMDLDGIEMSSASGVSAPQVLGLSPREMIAAATWAARLGNIKLLDIAEYNPTYDRDAQTAKLAALLIWTFIMERTKVEMLSRRKFSECDFENPIQAASVGNRRNLNNP
jgi:formiminoglutamase